MPEVERNGKPEEADADRGRRAPVDALAISELVYDKKRRARISIIGKWWRRREAYRSMPSTIVSQATTSGIS